MERFQRFPLGAYLTSCRAVGRGKIIPEDRARAAALYDDVRVWRQTYEPVSAEMAKTLEMAEAFLWGEKFLLE